MKRLILGAILLAGCGMGAEPPGAARLDAACAAGDGAACIAATRLRAQS